MMNEIWSQLLMSRRRRVKVEENANPYGGGLKHGAVSFLCRSLNGRGFVCECRCCCHRDQKSLPCGKPGWRAVRCEISPGAASNAKWRRRNRPLRVQRCNHLDWV